jgi:hypothetical protein
MIPKWTEEYKKQYDREAYHKNKESRHEYMRKYREDHKQEISDKKRELYRIKMLGESVTNRHVLDLLIEIRNEYLKRTA